MSEAASALRSVATDDTGKGGGFSIGLADSVDVDELQWLLDANAPSRGGTLTGEFPREKVAAWLASGMPVVVARDVSGVAGVLFSSERSETPPVVAAMLRAWPGSADAYVYGPICIAERARGHHLSERLYAELRRQLPQREAILFIRRDNAASLRAHARLGMREVAAFEYEGASYVVLSDGGAC